MSNTSIIFTIVVTICMILSFTSNVVSALDTNVDVQETNDVSNYNHNNMIMMVQQFDDAYTQLRQEYYSSSTSMQIETCIPCHQQDSQEDSHHERLLAVFPGLRNRVKTFLSGVDTSNTDQYIETIASSIITSNQVGNETSTGGFLNMIKENPLLYIGGFALALVIILPLAILEGISTTTSTPIFCILGAATSPLFGACRRRLLRLHRELTVSSEIKSFLQQFFNNNGQQIVPDASTDVNVELGNIIQFGLLDNTIGYLNNVTIVSALTDVANSEFVTPIVSASLIAIVPLLMLQGISERTNTPIKCILPNNSNDCNHRHRQLQEDETDQELQELEEQQRQCEIINSNCHMKNMLYEIDYKN
jgi:ABC-type multidrug transport system fused ATPase/permease subunit